MGTFKCSIQNFQLVIILITIAISSIFNQNNCYVSREVIRQCVYNNDRSETNLLKSVNIIMIFNTISTNRQFAEIKLGYLYLLFLIK